MFSTPYSKAFNRLHEMSAHELRDFVSLPLVLNERYEDLWSGIRDSNLPNSLNLRLEQFKSRGRFVPYENDIIDPQLWIDMLIGFGVVPERFDPLTNALRMPQVVPALRGIAHDFTRIIKDMPSQHLG